MNFEAATIDGDYGHGHARDLPPGRGQTFLMEVVDFLDDEGRVVGPGACVAIDGECNGYDGYCGGCGGCLMLQAAHAGLRLSRSWVPMRVSHRLAWDDALRDVEAWVEQEERDASEAVTMADPDGVRRLPAYMDNDAAKRAGLRLGQPYRSAWTRRLAVVW